MKITKVAVLLGMVALYLGIIGLISGEAKIGTMLNKDVAYDMYRIGIGAFLLWGGIKSEEASLLSLSVFGKMTLGLFAIGFLYPTFYNLFPNGLGWVDQLLHVIAAAGALFATRGHYPVRSRHIAIKSV